MSKIRRGYRNKAGQFVKGVRVSPDTEFKKGQHWRKPQLFRYKDWLYNEYVTCGKSAGEIALAFSVKKEAIYFWMKKHGIPRRSIAEVRGIKHWGNSGPDNPMWNKFGESSPNWKGGITADRQAFYQSHEWKGVCSAIWKRDRATCQRCKLKKSEQPDMPFHIHHIVSFAVVELRADPNNLVLLCEVCHLFVHSKKNINKDFIKGDEQKRGRKK